MSIGCTFMGGGICTRPVAETRINKYDNPGTLCHLHDVQMNKERRMYQALLLTLVLGIVACVFGLTMALLP